MNPKDKAQQRDGATPVDCHDPCYFRAARGPAPRQATVRPALSVRHIQQTIIHFAPMKKYIAIFAVATALLNSGCVVGRRTVDLTIPQATSYPESKGSVSVGQVNDKRQFANKPTDPSTPSIDGDVGRLDSDTKALMIGRQRNGYGKALGDIALPRDRSVILLGRELLVESLKRNGYSVSESESDKSIDVNIDEFWAWFSPGMWSVSFEARIYCTLTVKRKSDSKSVVIQGYGINKGQVASDANWQLAYQRAFEDFLSKSATELKSAGL